MDSILKTRFLSRYGSAILSLVDEAGVIDAGSLQEPHLPLWGQAYAQAPVRLAFIGQDTRNWGEMTPFLAQARESPEQACLRWQSYFRELPYVKWTNRAGTSFWDTVFRILAGANGIKTWKDICRGRHDDLLRTFVWAEVNSVELWTAQAVARWETRTKKKADIQVWRKLKLASERCLDRLSLILDVFSPHAIVILNWHIPAHYWDRHLEWTTITDHLRHATDGKTGAQVFHSAHPAWLGRKRSRLTEVIQLISERLPRAIVPDSN
jgi:hypothetical protein